jgi:fumarate hydratase subunit alpha
MAELEKEIMERINRLGIGPAGFGGSTTALAVNIECYPTHIAGLPVAVNIGCHATRHSSVIL